MCNTKEPEPQIVRHIGQQWFRCPGEVMLAENVIISAGGYGLILCDVFLVTGGPNTGKRVAYPVTTKKLETYSPSMGEAF